MSVYVAGRSFGSRCTRAILYVPGSERALSGWCRPDMLSPGLVEVGTSQNWVDIPWRSTAGDEKPALSAPTARQSTTRQYTLVI